jgi:hypothetical protein
MSHTDLPATWFAVVDGGGLAPGDVVRVVPGGPAAVTIYRTNGPVVSGLSYFRLQAMLAQGELLPLTESEARLLMEALPESAGMPAA